ncbi:MAG TPA: AAA family ATPase [Solirubrobacteraceae bacterium]|nr:AAA family ATPase [Solirubrobacteraceae bacterium]
MENPGGFRFCGGCATPLATAQPRQARKIVTALFCDVTGSTALGEQLDPEVLRGVMNRYFDEIRAIVERHGGTVDSLHGDAVMAVFGIPQVREDDALRAVRAAAEIRARLPALADEVGVALRFRTGVNTGLVLMGEGDNLAIGDAVNVAARLEQTASPGEIVLGPETASLVRDAVRVEPLEPLTLKGKSEPVAAFRLLAVDPHAPGIARHLDAPLVGRERELQLLHDAWDRAVRERGCHLLTLLGTAGIGKSRLVGELLARVADGATVLRGRCLHYGEGITFWPLVEALTPVGEPARAVLDRLDRGGVAAAEELFWEARRLLESLASDRPVVLHVDDLQWAQPMLLDLLDHVADLSRGVPILMLCTARPELLEDRPAWGAGKLNASTVLLEPLDLASSERLLAQLGDGLDPTARERVIAASEGNPLFLEEMVALAGERGTVSVPATIQALLAARLERLPETERELLARGAIEGEVFHRLAIRALASERLAGEVEQRLAGLVRKELIRPHPATFRDDEAFRFRHLLIRDAAYDALPKAERAELHERFADWLERVAGELAELDEIVGWHLEQALRYQRELGRAGDERLARRAAERLHAAGRRADHRSDAAAARNLLGRALALVPDGPRGMPLIAVDLAEQLLHAGELDRVDVLLSEIEGEGEVAGLARIVRFDWLYESRPHEVIQTIGSTLPGILEQLEAAGDERALAKAHMVAFGVHWVAGRATAAGEEARLAAEHARSAGNEGLRSLALGKYISALTFGRAHVSEVACELDRIEDEGPGALLAAMITRARAAVCLMEGRWTIARRLAGRAIEAFDSLGLAVTAAKSFEVIVLIELGTGNPSAAIAAARKGDAILGQLGEHMHRSTMQAFLAEANELLHNRDAARAALELAEQLGADDDEYNQLIIGGVRARLALSDGDFEEAERWARDAVEHAMRTDIPADQAKARLNLAHVLTEGGRADDALAEAHAALELYELKGDRPGAEQARSVLKSAQRTAAR